MNSLLSFRFMMRNGTRPADQSISSSSSPAADCDDILGFKMQRTESFPCKTAITTVDNAAGGSSSNPYSNDSYDVLVGSLPRTLTSGPGGDNYYMPFTAIQWEELQRQRMIYKYMNSSIPVPTELLSYIDPTIKFNSKNSDPEPWRCRRTDGKKWRCSRDVASDLKYCERHAHKNRPRSRKPVESQTHDSNTRSLSNKTDNSQMNYNLPAQPSSNPVFQFPEMVSSSTADTAFRDAQKRWFAKGNFISDSSLHDQQWNQLREIPYNSVNTACDDQYISNVFSEEPEMTRHFIDAWSCSSEKDEKRCSVSSSSSSPIDKPLLSPLSLWMSGYQPPGGPLGEALGPNMAKIGNFSEDAIGFRF